jgi:integrase
VGQEGRKTEEKGRENKMIYKRGKNGTYWIRFRFAGRFVHESTRTTSRKIARDAEQQRRHELELSVNGLKERRSLPPTLEKAAAFWLGGRKHLVAVHTMGIANSALKHLLPVFGKMLLCDIELADVQKYQQLRLRERAAARTVNIEIATLRQIMKANDCWQQLAKVKMLRENKDAGKVLSPDEEKRLLEATRTLDSVCHVACVIALNTAARKDEIRNLRWSQIDFEHRTLTIGKSKSEAGQGRTIPLNATAFQTVRGWAGRFPQAKPSDYLFPACENRKVDATRPIGSWRTSWRTALRISGFHCRFHDLRVTAITKLSESGVADTIILSLAGHVSRKMLEHYSKIRTEAKRSAMDNLMDVNQKAYQVPSVATEAFAKLLN